MIRRVSDFRWRERSTPLAAALTGLALLVGCSTQGGNSTPVAAALASGGASTAYVVQAAQEKLSVIELATAPGSSVAPFVFTSSYGSSQGIGSGFFINTAAIAVDSSGQVYLNGELPDGTPQIQVFLPNGSTAPHPVKLFYPFSTIEPIAAMTTDASAQLYIAGNNSVEVFPSTVSIMNPLPTRTITLPSMQTPTALAVDSSGNIYVACSPLGASSPTGTIYVYSTTAASPTRAITSSVIFSGIAVDSSGDIFAVENSEQASAVTASNVEALVEFSPTASGAAEPVKTISGSNTGMHYGGGLTIDGVGNLYLVDLAVTGTGNVSTATPTLLVFGPTASGNEPPGFTNASSVWQTPSSQIAVH